MRTDTQQVPFLDLHAQHLPLRPALDAALAGVIDTNAFTLGPAVRAFEEQFAAYCESPRCIGVSSGTEALSLMLRAHGIGPGDEVITAPNTFIATVEAIAAAGATAVLADVDPHTWLLSAATVEPKITAKTKAVLVIHLYGNVAPLDEFTKLCASTGILLLEDACQAHGAKHGGRRVGHGSKAAAFSFYPGKNLGGFGDGGAVVTDDPEVAARLTALRHHGQTGKNEHTSWGTTARLDSIQAAVLSVKLPHLDGWNERRRQHASLYRELLAGSRYTLPVIVPETEPVHHLFVLNHPEIRRAKQLLSEKEIGWGEHYPRAIHLQSAFSELGRAGDYPVAEGICANILSLPMYAEMDDWMVRRVCEVLLEVDS
jgi:dTDP-4-amino-4,6-dideoxygalactose transaminase